MISLAGRDILHGWEKFTLTGLGLGLLIGVTLTMGGVFRGMGTMPWFSRQQRPDLWVSSRRPWVPTRSRQAFSMTPGGVSQECRVLRKRQT